jgi:hypothetical protein
MRTLRIFLIATFLLSLLVGFIAGRFIFPGKSSVKQTLPADNNLPAKPGTQDGIWVIAVDRLNKTSPKIEGIWLFSYITNYTKIKPLPLYPSDNPERDAELAKTFRLTSDQKIAPAFWELVQKHGNPIRNYIIIDEIAAVGIINFFGGVTIQGKQLNGLEALNQTPKTWDDPKGSLRGQIAIMDSICKSIFNGQSSVDLLKLQKDVGHHLLSDLDLGKKTKEWQQLINDGNYRICDFPDLYESLQINTYP